MHSNLGMYRVQFSGNRYEAIATSGFITRSIAASACIMPRRWN